MLTHLNDAPPGSAVSVRTASRDEETLPDLLRIFRVRRWIIAVAFILTTGVATAFSLIMPPVYVASSTLISDRIPPVVLLSGSGQDIYQQQVSQAPDVLTFTEIVRSEAVRAAAAARLSSLVGPAKANAMLAHVTVQRLRDTEVVKISATSNDPDDAARAVNELTQSVIALDLKARRRLVSVARKFLGDQQEVARQRLRTAENLVTAFKNENRDVSLSEQTSLNLRKLWDLEARLADARLQELEIQSGGDVPAASSDPQTPGTLMQSRPDPLASTLQHQLTSLEVELSGLRKQFTVEHPQVIAVQAKIEETKRRLSAAVARNRAGLAAREQGLSNNISQVEQTLTQIPTREAALVRLTRNAKEAERTYLTLSAQFQGAYIAEGSIGTSVRIIDTAKPPTKPAGPKRGLNTLLGAIVGLMVGVTAAYVVEQLDNTVRSAEEAGQLLGAPVLGVIPRLGRAGTTLPVLTQAEQATRPAEEFRGLRTHLLGALRGAGHKSVIITSALPDEGKSSIAANLAVTIARSDRSVWLVDCDLRHPALKDFFPEADSPGLAGLLNGRAVIDGVVRPTAQPHLKCIVSGPAGSNAAELLDTQLMAGLLTSARGLADVILLDSPALLAVADAEILGPYVDGALMVVRAGKADRHALVQARDRLERARVRLVGVVFNDTRGRSRWRG
jgi:capsular exopolysaccharide synthesis family protein